MNFLLTIVTLIAFVLFILTERFKSKRIHLINNLKTHYDQMEMFFIKKDIKMNRDYVELLKIFKNITVNPDFLDIQILVITQIASEKKEKGTIKQDKKWFDTTLKSLGPEFEIIFKEFDKNADSIVKLSFYKWDFITFILATSFKLIIKSRIKQLGKAKKIFQQAQNNEEIITYQAMKNGAIC